MDASEAQNLFNLPSPTISQAQVQKVATLRPLLLASQLIPPLYLFQRVKWSGLLLMVGCVTTVGVAVPVGYNIGVINSIGEMITAWLQTTLMDRTETVPTDVGLDLIMSTVVAIFLVGGAVGSLGGAWVADRFGR